MADATTPLPLVAFEIHEWTPFGLTTAQLERSWMDQADQRHPYRCLPLNIANQSGWWVTCPTDFRVYWYGGLAATDLEVQFAGAKDPSISSHFGQAVLTFSMPFLFRTPPGINLWVKGPANQPKDGIQALEGVVETDWAVSTFTMNWKVTRPNEWIHFQAGEPICNLLPYPRGFLEQFVPVRRPLATEPELQGQYKAWEAGRRGFLEGLRTNDPETVKRGWQKDYFQGKTDQGTFRGHQTRLDLKDFQSGDSGPASSASS